MKLAIKEKELNALISKYKRGDFVLWEELAKEAETRLYRFSGVGRINALPAHKVTASTRYVHTKGELAALFGVTRTTFSRWEAAGLITTKRIMAFKPSQQLRKGCRWVYDAKDVLNQLKRQIKTQNAKRANKM